MPVITRKKLEDYKKNKRSIPMLEAELDEMLHTDAGLGSSVILDYKKGYPAPQSVVGFNGPAYDRRQKELERIKKDCQEVEEWIAAIEEGNARCVFKMFYIDGMGWEKIAKKTGYSKSPDYPRLMIRDKYLKDYKIM